LLGVEMRHPSDCDDHMTLRQLRGQPMATLRLCTVFHSVSIVTAGGPQ
jgi:hypothetical protein